MSALILPHGGKTPRIDPSVLVVPNATIIGDVVIGAASSIWFQVVIRGDVNFIRIGDRTNIQDGTVVHVTNETHPTIIGDDVTVGHNVTLHGCSIGNRCLVGMGSVVLDGVEVGDDCLIGAGAVVTPGTVIPSRSLVVGSPAKVRRSLTDDEVSHLHQSAQNYVDYKESYSTLL
ncbi:MAG: gamma carbonic anhydrase family protein [Desulfuromonas sp.]|nr:MAG: gamma carbonic anhydrase family protein [Desulfuromonas sp.]